MGLRIIRGRLLILLPLLLASCVRENPLPQTIMHEIPFRVVDDPSGTRSLLSAGDIETKRTGITLAAYRDGILETCRHFTSEKNMTLRLGENRTYSIYAFVNMGDLTSTLPGKENYLRETFYTVPSYQDINRTGLPMSGCGEKFRIGDGSGGTIRIRRLFAKITASLRCDWDGASIERVKVRGLNGRLPLWGAAAATSASDMTGEEDLDTGSGPQGTFVFYVPENRQGTIPGISASSSKAPDKSASVKAKETLLTYLEAEVYSSGSYGGTVLFRSYLGNNATNDFDIEGNVDYRWTIHYHEDGLQENNWKTDTGELTDSRFLEWTANPIRVQAGKTYSYQDFLNTNIPAGQIEKSLYGDGKAAMVSSSDRETFTIRADAPYGTVCTAEAKPLRNCIPSLIKTTTLKVSDSRYIRWIDSPDNPVKTITLSEAEPEIFDGEPVLVAGFEMGNGQGPWYWQKKRIYAYESLSKYLDLTIPASLTGGKSGVSNYLYFGTDQDHCINGNEYENLCGVIQIFHPYARFKPGVHDLILQYKDEPDCAITLRLNILPSSGKVTFHDVYELEPDEATIDAGQTQSYSLRAYTLRYIDGSYAGYRERSADYAEMTWSSSDPQVATVSDGVATGLDEGTAAIQVRFRESGKLVYETASAKLHVTRGWRSEYELGLKPERADLLVGSTRKYIATLTTYRYFNDALQSTESKILGNTDLSWKSSAPAVASVENGEISGLSPGITVITATYRIGGQSLSAESTVTVKENNGIHVESGWTTSGTVILN